MIIYLYLILLLLGGCYNSDNHSMVDAYHHNNNYRITSIDNDINNRFHNNYQYKINHHYYNNPKYNSNHRHNVYMVSDSFMSFGNQMTIDIKLPTREKRVAIDFLKSPKKILGMI